MSILRARYWRHLAKPLGVTRWLNQVFKVVASAIRSVIELEGLSRTRGRVTALAAEKRLAVHLQPTRS